MRGINATPKRTSRRSRSTVLPPHPWDVPGLSRAERVIRFVNSLPCTQGPLAGTTLKLRLWQTKFIRAVYRTDKHGNRLVRTAVLSVSRRTGRLSWLRRCVCVPYLVLKASLGANVTASPAQDKRVFDEMVAVITRVPWLNKRINIVRFRRELEDMDNGSTFRVPAADVAPVMGLSPSFVCYDELGQVPNRDLYDALSTALGGRAQPLMLVISTQAASDIAPMSELVDYGLRIERGEIKDAGFHLTLYTAPPESDPWKFATWKLANPALGDFRSLEDVKRLALQAQRIPASGLSFRRYILNQRVDTSAPFLNMMLWEENSANEYDIRDLKGRQPYRLWRDEGYLLTFPGRATDPEAVATKIAELHGMCSIKALAFDRRRIEDIKRELDAIGCNIELVPFGQGFKDLSPAVDVLERLLEQGKLRHDGHPVLKMAAANCRVEMDSAGNRKLSKRKSTGRIDPIVATCMAIGIAARPAPVIDFASLIG